MDREAEYLAATLFAAVKARVDQVADGSATVELHMLQGRDGPLDGERPVVRIRPRNEAASSVELYIENRDQIDVAIGQATWFDLHDKDRDKLVAAGVAYVNSVLTAGFSEKTYHLGNSTVLARTRININERDEWILTGNVASILLRLFARKNDRTFRPYI